MKKIRIENKDNTYKNRHVAKTAKKKKTGRPNKPFNDDTKAKDKWFSVEEILNDFKKKS